MFLSHINTIVSPVPAIGIGFPFLAVFLAFIIFLAIRQHAVSSRQKEIQEKFWEDELKANSNVGVPFSSIEFMTLPLESFPIGRCPVDEIRKIEEELLSFAEKPLLNLTGMTNTEVKSTYGVPNFEKLSEIGEDFDKVTVLLNDYGRLLLENEMDSEAISILEYAINVKTDISQSYITLADCYKKRGFIDKLINLRETVDNTSLILKPTILAHIDECLPNDENNGTADINADINTDI